MVSGWKHLRFPCSTSSPFLVTSSFHLFLPLLSCVLSNVSHCSSPLNPTDFSPFRTELPPDHCNVIRVELFKHLASFSSGHRLVLIQLCRALVGVVFHTMPDQWPNAVVSCIHSLKKACQDLPVSLINLMVVVCSSCNTVQNLNFRGPIL